MRQGRMGLRHRLEGRGAGVVSTGLHLPLGMTPGKAKSGERVSSSKIRVR